MIGPGKEHVMRNIFQKLVIVSVLLVVVISCSSEEREPVRTAHKIFVPVEQTVALGEGEPHEKDVIIHTEPNQRGKLRQGIYKK